MCLQSPRLPPDMCNKRENEMGSMNHSPARRRMPIVRTFTPGLLCLTCFVAANLRAQAPGQVQSQPLAQQNGSNKQEAGAAAGAREIAKAEGKLEAQQGQTLKISTTDNKEIFVQVGPGTALKYSGEADRSWLSPGMMVRFSTRFDQGKAVAPLKSLDVFMPVLRPGMTMEQMREQTPGIYQEGKTPPPGAKGLFADDSQKPGNKGGSKPAGNKPADAAQPAVGASAAYRVVGKLMGLHGNTIMVMAEQPMQFELDPAATISVTSSDLTFAVHGDPVAVSGLRNPAEPAYIQAEKLEIKAAQKLTQAQPTARGRTRGNLRGKAAEADESDAKDGKPAVKKPGSVDRRTGATNKSRGANVKPDGAAKPNGIPNK